MASFQDMLIGIANDVRESLFRINRLESQVALANVNNVQCCNTVQNIHFELCVMKSHVQTLQQATVNSSASTCDVTKLSQVTTSSEDSVLYTLSEKDYCAFPACKELLSHNNRACSSAVSLRHMLCCNACPSGVCRVLYILNHMSNFGRAPQVSLFFRFLFIPHTQQVCHLDTCCYCGSHIANMSADDRTKHRKMCIIVSFFLFAHISALV